MARATRIDTPRTALVTRLCRLIEDLWRFVEAHPEMVADLSLTVRVRSEAQVPPVFGERSTWIIRDKGRRYLDVRVVVGHFCSGAMIAAGIDPDD